MNITFILSKGKWHETQHRNRRGGFTKKFRMPHGLRFTFNLGEKPQPRRRGQGRRYHLCHNHKKQTQNFRGGKYPRNSQCWWQHNQRTQQQQEQPQTQRVSSQFTETVSPSDFQPWEREDCLSPALMSQDHAWQPSVPTTSSQQQQVKTQCSLQRPEQRRSRQIPSQFYETVGPREFGSWKRLNHFNQATQNYHVWQSPAPTTSSQQQQYDTQYLLGQGIEKMRQNHQSQTQQEQLRDERERNLQQCLDNMRMKYQLQTQQAQYNIQLSPEAFRSPILRACPSSDEDEASAIFDGYHYV